MSAATATLRAASETAQSAAQAKRRSWLQSLKDKAVSFVKGDNDSPWAILAETVIGCVPVLGQVVDARDIIKGLVEVAGNPNNPLGWFNLITAIIGVIPGGGDAVKRALRAVKSGAMPIDQLLAIIRRFYKGDPEKLLREMLDVSKVRATLDRILTNPTLLKHISPEIRKKIDLIRSKLDEQFAKFKAEVEGWLSKERRTSADGRPAKPATGDVPATPESPKRTGSANRDAHSNAAAPTTPNPAKQRTERFKTLSQKALGVLGEHMADYHCQEVKGWGTPTAHDKGGKNSAKLNDGGHLVQLWPLIARGRGIDAVWKTPGPKPYAIIEAKASCNPAKTLAGLLGEAGDKSDGGGRNSGGLKRRSGTGGRTAAGSDSVRQTNGKVTQMSKAWIQRRLPRAAGGKNAADDLIEAGYTRHVLFFSIPHAVAHAEALVLHATGHGVQTEMHAGHQVTREWQGNQVAQVVNDRAGTTDAKARRSH